MQKRLRELRFFHMSTVKPTVLIIVIVAFVGVPITNGLKFSTMGIAIDGIALILFGYNAFATLTHRRLAPLWCRFCKDDGDDGDTIEEPIPPSPPGIGKTSRVT